jgi:hypothetical protein
MKNVIKYTLILFLPFFLLDATAQEGPNDPPSDPINPPKMGGEAYTAPADYPHVKSQIEIQADNIMQQQKEFLENQKNVLKKIEEGGTTESPQQNEETAATPDPQKRLPSSSVITEETLQCKHVTITMPETVECGYLITTGEEGKSAKVLMLESENIRKDQCVLDIDCERPRSR